MVILNLMLGKGRGGLEQAAIDYAEVLQATAIPAITVVSPGAWAQAPLAAGGLPHETLANFARWDPLAVLRLRALVARTQATAILCHGNRAVALALTALKGRIPVIAVAHNASTRRFARADHAIAITEALAAQLRAHVPVTVIANMVRVPALPSRPPMRTPPVIGSMGRLHPVKGVDQLLDALAVLAQRGVAYQAVIGGDGDELASLRNRAQAYGIDDRVHFAGWIKDKEAFFDSIDLFVLPSRQESFGLALLEAMAHQLPVVTSDANGPREIAHHGTDALVVKRGDADAMADAIAALLASPSLATTLGRAARALVEAEYTPAAMGSRLHALLAPYMRGV